MHLVGFIIRIYHDARSHECGILFVYFFFHLNFVSISFVLDIILPRIPQNFLNFVTILNLRAFTVQIRTFSKRERV